MRLKNIIFFNPTGVIERRCTSLNCKRKTLSITIRAAD